MKRTLLTLALLTSTAPVYAMDLTCELPAPDSGDTNPAIHLHILTPPNGAVSIDYTMGDGTHRYRETQYKRGWNVENVPSSQGPAVMWQGWSNSTHHVNAFIKPLSYREDHYENVGGKDTLDHRAEFDCHNTQVVQTPRVPPLSDDEIQRRFDQGNRRFERNERLALPDCADPAVFKMVIRVWLTTSGGYNGTAASMLIQDTTQSMGIDRNSGAKTCITHLRADESVARDAEAAVVGVPHPLMQMAHSINQRYDMGNPVALSYRIALTGEGSGWMVSVTGSNGTLN